MAIARRRPTVRDAADRDAPSPTSTERIAALRAAVIGAKGLPQPWRDQLASELALAFHAAELYLAR